MILPPLEERFTCMGCLLSQSAWAADTSFPLFETDIQETDILDRTYIDATISSFAFYPQSPIERNFHSFVIYNIGRSSQPSLKPPLLN